MLSGLSRRLTYSNVMSTLAVFGVLAGGTAYAANTVFSSDIVDGEVKSVDIGNNEIGSADVKDGTINTFDVHSFLGVDVVDGSLEDQDIAEGTFVNFNAVLAEGGDIHPHTCDVATITGINAQADHLLLTGNAFDSPIGLVHSIEYHPGDSNATLKSCNVTNLDLLGPVETHFNLLVIDAN
jgi:hypothetical protein